MSVTAIAFDYGGTLTMGGPVDPVLNMRPVDPRAATAVRDLRGQGATLVIASNTRPDQDRVLALRRAGIYHMFASVLQSHVFGIKKPEPRFYEGVCAALGCGPAEVLFVGNNIRTDVSAPLLYGMRAALVRPSGLASGETLPDGAFLIKHVADLCKRPWAGG